MSRINKHKYKGHSEYNVLYSDMRGVDFSSDGSQISRNRFAYLENMYCDYESGGSLIESIPGYRSIAKTGKRINALYSYKSSSGDDMIVAHAENELMEFALKDADNSPEITVTRGVENCESDAYQSKNSLFVLDGKQIFKLSDTYRGAISEGCDEVYVPTTYVNGIPREQRNLLTRAFIEKLDLGFCESSAFGTPGLKYAIIDESEKKCRVTGLDGEYTRIYIPTRVLIGERYYSISEIGKHAFKENKSITQCYVASGVSRIGVGAFSGCTNLTKVILSDTVCELMNNCFMGCEKLSELHLGLATRTLGMSVVNTCPALSEITYSGSESDFAMIENANVLGSCDISYNVEKKEIAVGIKIYDPCVAVTRVTIDGNEVGFEAVSKDGIITDVIINLTDKNLYNGKCAEIRGTLSSEKKHYKEEHSGFVSSAYSEKGSIASAISGCTIAESFDGRIFLTGNPSYPGYTFYSSFDQRGENNPLYFGELNYFRDGVGAYANTVLLAAGDSLAVFKEGDDGGGSIFYHTPCDSSENLIPRIYPVSYVHSGFAAKGRAISFFDDPVFVSTKGISALSKKNINLERSIATRSSNVNYKLLSEDLKQIKLAVWMGYLVVLCKDRIYLADSRSTFTSEYGNFEYEWYYLSGVGSFENDKKVYRYSSTSHTGYDVHANTDKKTEAEVYSEYSEDVLVYYTNEDGTKYEVYPTEELIGGDFFTPSDIISVDDKLIFGTENGEIFIFNSDKRGVPPPYVSNSDSFDKDEYERSFGRSIHPYYYSFAGHAPRYALQTKKDDGGLPHLAKTSVKDSLAIKCKAMSSGKIICEAGTDTEGYREVCKFPARDVLFDDLSFASLTLGTSEVYTLPIRERSKNWIEKQITVYSDEYASPFGIYLIAYSFFVKGKIKKGR